MNPTVYINGDEVALLTSKEKTLTALHTLLDKAPNRTPSHPPITVNPESTMVMSTNTENDMCHTWQDNSSLPSMDKVDMTGTPTAEQLSHLGEECSVSELNTFWQECKSAKYNHMLYARSEKSRGTCSEKSGKACSENSRDTRPNDSRDALSRYSRDVWSQDPRDGSARNSIKEQQMENVSAHSAVPLSAADLMQRMNDKKGIIPEMGAVKPQADLTHLDSKIRRKIENLIEKHEGLFSKGKHHLGKFTGFQVEVHTDKNSRHNCRQSPRNRHLPESCVYDLQKYREAGLFAISEGMADKFCANITLVLRSSVKESKDTSKATKYINKQASKKDHQTKNQQGKKTHATNQADPSSQRSNERKGNNLPQEECSQRSLYRMTIDFRDLNKVTLNEKKSPVTLNTANRSPISQQPCLHFRPRELLPKHCHRRIK